MPIDYKVLIEGVASAIELLKGITGIGDRAKVQRALNALESAIRQTVRYLEVDPQGISDLELAEYWRVAGRSLSEVPNMAQATRWIFEKELYYRRGRRQVNPENADRITMNAMLTLTELLRERLDNRP